MSVSLDSFDIFEPAGAGHLVGQDAVKLRIEAVSIDRGRDEFADPDAIGRPPTLSKALETTCDSSCVWRSMTAATSASLFGKY